jgi:uncharacterized delta-60 repeat protein
MAMVKEMKMKLLLGFAVVAGMLSASLGAGPAFGQAAGSLDPTFGTGGTSLTNISTSIIDAIELQSNSEILVLLGPTSGANELVRFSTTGALDTTFGTNGVASLASGIGLAIALQPNGQIVVMGIVSNSSGNFVGVERLNANGTEDTTFGTGGLALASLGTRAPLEGDAILVESNGDILVAVGLDPAGRRASGQVFFARFLSTGAPDNSFGTDGVVIANGAASLSALALLSNGDFLNTFGSTVVEFSANGTQLSSVSEASLVASSGSNNSVFSTDVFQPNGDFLYASDDFVGEESRGHNSSVLVQRFTEAGAADSTFADPSFHFVGAGGDDIEALVNGIAVAPNGDIVVVGQQTTFAQAGDTTVNGLARLTPSGALDTTFGSGGLVSNSIPSGSLGFNVTAVQSNGNIVVAGIANNDLFLSRYLGN